MPRRLIRQPAHAFEAINVTPLIDVVMCLIVFFLIVGKLAADAGALRLPQSASGRAAGSERAIIVSIGPERSPGDGAIALAPAPTPRTRVFIDGTLISSADQLDAALRAAANTPTPSSSSSPPAAAPPSSSPTSGASTPTAATAASPASSAKPAVVVRADRDLPYAAIEPVLAAAARAGLTAVRLATERAQ